MELIQRLKACKYECLLSENDATLECIEKTMSALGSDSVATVATGVSSTGGPWDALTRQRLNSGISI